MSDYICTQNLNERIDMKKCMNKYLWPIYSNIFVTLWFAFTFAFKPERRWRGRGSRRKPCPCCCSPSYCWCCCIAEVCIKHGFCGSPSLPWSVQFLAHVPSPRLKTSLQKGSQADEMWHTSKTGFKAPFLAICQVIEMDHCFNKL